VVDEEQPQQPDDIRRLLNIFKQMMGSVHDQVNAVKAEALDTANTALKLAADSELHSTSSAKEFGEEFERLREWSIKPSQSLLKLLQIHDNTFTVQTSMVNLNFQLSLIYPLAVVTRDANLMTQVYEVASCAFSEFGSLMLRAVAPSDEETFTKLGQEANAIVGKFTESALIIIQLYWARGQQS
jgi:hypothetical protein